MSERKLQIQPTFVKTGNVRTFEALLAGLALSPGEGRLGLVYGQAGRGKTRTTQWYAVNNRSVFLHCQKIWRSSELGFLQALCKEYKVTSIPGRKVPAFQAVLEAMIANKNKPLFIEEIEELPGFFLELVKDLTDLSTAPIILVGENKLVTSLKENRRIWSRTFRQMEFQPVEPADLVSYVNQSTGIRLSPEVTEILHQSCEGDFRLVKRDLANLVDICNANNTTDPTPKMAKVAVKLALSA